MPIHLPMDWLPIAGLVALLLTTVTVLLFISVLGRIAHGLNEREGERWPSYPG